VDKLDHNQAISLLFGIFYALLQSQVPWLTDQYESAISLTHIPCLDPNNVGQFTVLLPHNSVTFRGYPLASPEGYIAIDFGQTNTSGQALVWISMRVLLESISPSS
jgi:hypothetical protein